MNTNNSSKYRFFLFIGLLAFAFGGSSFYKRASIDLDGKIISSNTTCIQPQNNRCASTYVIENKNGVRTQYIAGFTDGALPRELPVGTYLAKRKWRLSYTVNDSVINNFPVDFYGGLVVFGLCLIGWSAFQWRSSQRNN